MEEMNTYSRSDVLVKVPPRKITPGMREALTALVSHSLKYQYSAFVSI